MVYRRAGRPSQYFEAQTQHGGYKQMCTHTSDKKLAQRMEHMWGELAERHRAFDLLNPVLERRQSISALYDAWEASGRNVEAMRRKAADVDIEPFIADWLKVYETTVEADTAAHALKHVRFLFPENTPRFTSTVTTDWLTTRLAEYPAKRRNTRRKVHSSWSVFFEYLVLPKRLFAANPMNLVERPDHQLVPPKFHDSVSVARIVAWQPTEARRAFMALVYGTGADVSPALIVDKVDINPATHEVRIMGTKSKNGSRDRIVRVSDTHWPTFWGYAKAIVSGHVFPEDWNRWTVADWHRQTVGEGTKDTHGNIEEPGLKLPRRHPLRNARHHFAVRLIQAGTPVRVVADQLGSNEKTVLKHYGRWIVSAEDRAKWEKMAAKYELKRSAAQ
jgi:Site-specific recombinase XerD